MYFVFHLHMLFRASVWLYLLFNIIICCILLLLALTTIIAPTLQKKMLALNEQSVVGSKSLIMLYLSPKQFTLVYVHPWFMCLFVVVVVVCLCLYINFKRTTDRRKKNQHFFQNKKKNKIWKHTEAKENETNWQCITPICYWL